MTTSYRLRYMRVEDIPQVVEVDRLSFPTPWSPRSYTFEINDNASSHMLTLEGPAETISMGGLRGVLQRLGGHSAVQSVAGYGGLWLIEGEAHVSTIAVHPAYRGRGLGEVLLNGMIARSMTLKAAYSVLEVRVGNESAQALYRKYGYEIVGRRKNYYRDNNEDAFLMHLAPFDETYVARLGALTDALHRRLTFADQLVQTANHRPPTS